MKKSFKTFFYEYLENVIKTKSRHYLLKESPIYTGLYNNFLNDPKSKENRLKDIKQFDKPIKTWKQFDVFYGNSITTGGKDYSFIFNNALMATFSVKSLKNKGLEILSVWNDIHDGKGLARQIIFEYFLPKYTFIICGESHTEQGKQFWLKLILQGLENNLKISILNLQTKEEKYIANYADLNHKEIWSKNKHNIRLKISK